LEAISRRRSWLRALKPTETENVGSESQPKRKFLSIRETISSGSGGQCYDFQKIFSLKNIGEKMPMTQKEYIFAKQN
jgi:hypothetical protein